MEPPDACIYHRSMATDVPLLPASGGCGTACGTDGSSCAVPDDGAASWPACERSMGEGEADSLRAFAPLLRTLALTKDSRWPHRAAVMVLVSWSFVGWLVKLAYAINGEKMRDIPGFYEISASKRESLPSGLALTGMMVVFYYSLYRYFSRGCVFRVRNAEVERSMRRHARYVWCWALLSSVLGRTMNAFMARDSPVLRADAVPLVFDWVVSVLAFFFMFLAMALFWAHLAALCHAVSHDIGGLARWFSRSDAQRPLDETDARYRSLLARSSDVSREFGSSVLLALSLLAVGTATELIDYALADTRGEVRAYAFRSVYLFICYVPMAYSLGYAAAVSSEAQAMRVAACTRPVCDPLASTQMRVYFLASSITPLGFTLGTSFVIRPYHLARLFYVLGAVMATAVQYQLSASARGSS